MKNIKLGIHINLGYNLYVIKGFGFSVVQIMLSNPKSFQMPNEQHARWFIRDHKKVFKEPIYVHSPFTVSLVKPPGEKQCRFTVDYAKTLCKIAYDNDADIRFVTHLGVIPKDMTSGEAYNNLMRNLVNMHNSVKNNNGNFKVLLENDSGTRGRSLLNTAPGLEFIFRKNVWAQWFKELKWLGICFDTNHAYGSGFDRRKWVSFIGMCDAVHFNPIPDFMKPGDHKDFHHDYSFAYSKRKTLLKKVAEKATVEGKPLIIENNIHTILHSLDEINRWWRNES